jgi:hypothetical protein
MKITGDVDCRLQWVDMKKLVQLEMQGQLAEIIVGPRLTSQSQLDLSGLVGEGGVSEFNNRRQGQGGGEGCPMVKIMKAEVTTHTPIG